MIQSLYIKFQLSIAQSINRFIFSVLNFRPLKGLISEEWYVRRDIKKVLGVFAVLWAALGDIFIEVLYFALAICAPWLFLTGIFEWDVFEKGILWSFLCMNVLFGSFGNSHILGGCDEQQYLLLNLMRIDPKKHFLTEILWLYTKKTVYYCIIFAVMVHAVHCPVKLVVWIMACYVCMRPVGEALSLYFCERLGMPYRDKSKKAHILFFVYSAAVVLSSYGLYPLLFIMQEGKAKVYNPVFDAPGSVWGQVLFLVLCTAAAMWAVSYLRRYPHYTLVARRIYTMDKLKAAEIQAKELKKSGYEIDEKAAGEDIQKERLFPEKSGYDYFHAIFFHRHKKQLRDAVAIKGVITTVVMVLGACALIMGHVLVLLGKLPEASFEAFLKGLVSSLDRVFGLVVFIMYCASSGKNLTGAMFYNCDISLLKYGFYRKKEAILKSFRIRLRYMVRAELPLMAVFVVGIFGNGLLLHMMDRVLELVLLAACACILSVFYSVIYLCMYYIFQPYTEGGEVTGFGYKFCTAALYLFSYTCLQIHTAPVVFMAVVLGVTVAVLALGFGMVTLLAPKTFHLK